MGPCKATAATSNVLDGYSIQAVEALAEENNVTVDWRVIAWSGKVRPSLPVPVVHASRRRTPGFKLESESLADRDCAGNLKWRRRPARRALLNGARRARVNARACCQCQWRRDYYHCLNYLHVTVPRTA